VLGTVPSGAPRSPAARVSLVMEALSRAGSDLSKYEYLISLLHRDPRTFFAAALAHTAAIMPLVYTPTVGLACQRWSRLLLPVRGLYISLADAGRVEAILRAWPGARGVRAICVTDGERILGLGDLGANGMGIPVGKLALYSALAGVDPAATLPVTLDCGTNTAEVLGDACYRGVRAPREGGEAYYALVDEFVRAVMAVCGPRTLLQWEDFGNAHAFALLDKYKAVLPSFNDDIEGTAAVVLGGLLSACAHVPGVPAFEAGTYLFYGAGEAGVGIADLIAYAIARRGGGTVEAARKRIFLVDTKGLVTAERRGEKGFAHHKEPYAHTEGGALLAGAGAAGGGGGAGAAPAGLLALADIVRVIKPTALIGVSTQPSTFTREVVDAMAALNERPLIFALSNPTSKAECTAAEAYGWTNGRAVFASGSPFDPVTLKDGRVITPGQGNNSYIFPAVGLAVVATHMTQVPMHVSARPPLPRFFLRARFPLTAFSLPYPSRSPCMLPLAASPRR
jgi:malate dehydrogenase (oxaloacetate-decarboxylating)(NADP+)